MSYLKSIKLCFKVHSKSIFISNIVRSIENKSCAIEKKMSNEILNKVILRTDIIKAKEDQRLYRGLQLENQIKIVLVSDAKTEKSAAALEVNVGHMCDPDELPGLAHFCEHMLFLGTEKYPLENEYAKYLSEHGGVSNAFTAADSTQFYFEVLPDYFSGALDRFAQFFLAPLFTESSTDRELNAVNSEHEKNIPTDVWRLDQLERHTSKKGHPYQKFGTGNRKTLYELPKELGIDVREELLKFHKKWYSANLMTLAVLGKESLDELEAIVVPLFQRVLNKNVAPPEWLEHPMGQDQIQLKGYIVPVKDSRGVHITFPIPDFRQYYKSGPCQYLSHLIGHEGKGSLLSALKNKGWCNTLISGDRNSAKGFSFFAVSADLTPEGVEHVDEIVSLLFQYIEMLKREGPVRWIFEEYRDIMTASFRFKDKEQPFKYVSGIASNMFYYPVEEVLCGCYYYPEWSPELINKVLDYLVPSNVRLGIYAKKFASICDSTEPVYGTQYKLEKIDPTLIQKWESCGIADELKLPQRNVFIPSTYDLYPLESAVQHPFVLYDSPLTRVWFKQDDEFFLPKAKLVFDIYSPLAYLDPLNCCLSNLFGLLLKDDLNEYAYDASVAGLSWQIGNAKFGLQFTIDGYNDKQSVLLKKIVEKMINFKVDEKRFELLKEKYLRGLSNFEQEQPYKQAIWHMAVLTSEHAWTNDELLTTENQLTPSAMRDFIPRLFSKCKMEGLIHGNINKETALMIAQMPEQMFAQENVYLLPLLPRQLTRHRQIQMSNGSYYVYNQHNKFHRSSGSEIYYQCCSQSTQTNMELELLVQIIKEPCFDILRTKEQLGYIVTSELHRSSGVQGLIVLLQSDRHPAYLGQRTEAFLLHVRELLNDITDEEFERHREALAALRLEKPKKLADRTAIYWKEISTQQYHFDRNEVEVAYLRTISRDALLEFFDKYLAFDAPQRRKLAVHVISAADGGAGSFPEPDSQVLSGALDGLTKPPPYIEPKVIEDITQFKSSQGLYPLPQPYMAINGTTKSKL